MIFRNLDSDGDWTFGIGKGNYVADNTAIGLNIKTRILSWVNDCFFDLDAGIDWINRLGRKDTRAILEADLRRIILQSEGVTGIVSFDSTLTGRNFTANYSVNTIYSKEYQDSITQRI
ncbi:hypothetical protein [uncultured Paraglaciecola sp.]|uniref:hypothetical protein n=1 Tax=uncultured Paraglaciecola sp. TaxID=1765024 RepID=UPI002620965B|nr:hypothetical protein [uncultured Paraglaciecola sp.]